MSLNSWNKHQSHAHPINKRQYRDNIGHKHHDGHRHGPHHRHGYDNDWGYNQGLYGPQRGFDNNWCGSCNFEPIRCAPCNFEPIQCGSCEPCNFGYQQPERDVVVYYRYPKKTHHRAHVPSRRSSCCGKL